MDQTHGPLPISLIAEAWMERTKEIWSGKEERHVLSTGFKSLDAVVGGLYNSTLTVLAARPSVGKTSLAVSVVRHVSNALGRTDDSSATDCVVFFSLEMSKDMLMVNMMAQESSIATSFFRQRIPPAFKGRDTLNTKISQALDRMETWPLFIDDESRLLSSMHARLQTLTQLWTPRLIMVDYIQHMEPEDIRVSRNEATGTITRGLKALAKTYDCPVVALSQLSRAALYDNGHQIPDLQHLRDSGNLEQDADNVWFLWKPEYQHANLVDPEERGVVYVLVAKQRQGPRHIKVPLLFDAPTTRFLDCPKELHDTLEKRGKLEYYPDDDTSTSGRRK